MPVDIIDKLKTYDKKSDLARITGIDDGEEETVLDLTIKKGMNKGGSAMRMWLMVRKTVIWHA